MSRKKDVMDKDLLEKFSEYENEVHEKEVKLYMRMIEPREEGSETIHKNKSKNKNCS